MPLKKSGKTNITKYGSYVDFVRDHVKPWGVNMMHEPPSMIDVKNFLSSLSDRLIKDNEWYNFNPFRTIFEPGLFTLVHLKFDPPFDSIIILNFSDFTSTTDGDIFLMSNFSVKDDFSYKTTFHFSRSLYRNDNFQGIQQFLSKVVNHDSRRNYIRKFHSNLDALANIWAHTYKNHNLLKGLNRFFKQIN